jgi:hypothetical protein
MNPLPGQILYNTSKHGVLGLFRSLRSTSWTSGVRVNIICPYFIDTPFIPAVGRVILAGGAIGKPEDVIDAGTRLMADSRILGRALVVGPRLRVALDDELELAPKMADGKEVAIWELYGGDWEECEIFNSRFIKLMNAAESFRGWKGWASDMIAAFRYGLQGGRQ